MAEKGMRSEEEIRKRIEKLEKHAFGLRPQSRHIPRRKAKELRWVLNEVELS